MNTVPHLYGLKGKSVRAKLAQGRQISGVGLWFPYPLVAELVSRMGFDVLILDLEHGPWDTSSVMQVLSATSGSSAAIVVRPGGVDRSRLQLLLDLGVDGVMVGHCDDLETAQRAVSATKYPPLGHRGIGPTRTGGYLEDMPGYLREANDSVMLWLQVERKVPEGELTRMLTIPGVDALMLGPCDIAGSLGHLTDWDHPEVLGVIEETVNVARRLGKPFGVPGKQLDGQLIHLMTSDIGSLQEGLKQSLAAMTGNRRPAEHSL